MDPLQITTYVHVSNTFRNYHFRGDEKAVLLRNRTLTDHGTDEIVAQYKSDSAITSSEATQNAVEHPQAIEAVKALQAAGFDPSQYHGYHGPILSMAIASSDAPLTSYLLSQGADPNVGHDVSPLAAAAEDPDLPASTLSELFSHGAKSDNDPALHFAAALASPEKVRVLLEHGMDPQALYPGEQLQWDRRNSGQMARGNALHEAAGAHLTHEKAWRRDAKWNPDAQERVLRLLLQAGVDAHSQDDHGRRAVDWASNGPGYEAPRWKDLLGSDTKVFDQEKHLQRINDVLHV